MWKCQYCGKKVSFRGFYHNGHSNKKCITDILGEEE